MLLRRQGWSGRPMRIDVVSVELSGEGLEPVVRVLSGVA
jgi:hypothetical protein